MGCPADNLEVSEVQRLDGAIQVAADLCGSRLQRKHRIIGDWRRRAKRIASRR